MDCFCHMFFRQLGPIGNINNFFDLWICEGLSVVLLTSNFKLISNEFLIAFPYILTIVATIARRQFNVPTFLVKPYIKERG